MLLTAAFGIYFALLGVVAYDDLPLGKTFKSLNKRLPGKGAFKLRA